MTYVKDSGLKKPKRIKLRNIRTSIKASQISAKVFKRTDPVSVEQQDKLLLLKNAGLL